MIAPQRMQHVSSGGLALLVHGMLLLALMVGVSWKNPPHLPVEADIWTDLPSPPPPIVPPALEPSPAPPEPKMTAPPAPPDQAQIALEKEKKRAELHQAELQRQADKTLAEKKLVEDKRAEALRQAEQDRVEKQRVEKERADRDKADKDKADKEKRDQSRRQLDQEMARQAREELDAEGAQLRAMQARDKLSRQTRVVRDFQDRIRAKIKDALVMPQNLKGDAEVIFQVSLLPNGEVARVTLLKTSGQPLYDGAVERAIYKASPLPLPNERDTAAPFRDGLTLKFRPSEDTVGLH
jgi:colicin import membrane protein